MSKKNNKTFAEKAYKTTKLDYSYSQGKIQDMLGELGIENVRFTQIGSDYSVEFLVKLQPNEHPRKVKIDVPINSELGESIRRQNKKRDAIFRVLYYHLKNRFVVVSNGLREFEEEFLSDLVMVVNGKEQRLGDMLVPKYKAQLKNKPLAVISIN
jgi:hypothetical protein